jgi:hypothetical protein
MIRYFAIGLLVGGLLGLWLGVNIGKGRPLVSNPFLSQAPQVLVAPQA